MEYLHSQDSWEDLMTNITRPGRGCWETGGWALQGLGLGNGEEEPRDQKGLRPCPRRPGSWGPSPMPCFGLPGTSPAACARRLMSCSVSMSCKAPPSLPPLAQHLLCLIDDGPGATGDHKPEPAQCISSRIPGRLCPLLFCSKHER